MALTPVPKSNIPSVSCPIVLISHKNKLVVVVPARLLWINSGLQICHSSGCARATRSNASARKKRRKKKREYTSIICGTKKYILSTDVISCIFHFSLLAAKNNRQRQYEKEYRKSLFSNFSHFLSLTHLLCVRVRRRIPKII